MIQVGDRYSQTAGDLRGCKWRWCEVVNEQHVALPMSPRRSLSGVVRCCRAGKDVGFLCPHQIQSDKASFGRADAERASTFSRSSSARCKAKAIVTDVRARRFCPWRAAATSAWPSTAPGLHLSRRLCRCGNRSGNQFVTAATPIPRIST
jgi:hypothetical protein